MEQDLEKTMAVLERTPGALDALLRGLPDEWTHSNEGEGTWNVAEVVAHLIHCERVDWLPRVKIVVKEGEGRVFDALDREGNLKESEGRPLGALLDEFVGLRAANLVGLRGMRLEPRDMERRGRHPAQGVVVLRELLAAWAAHDLTHLHQISRVMAHQYREAVGKWGEYLGVMQCGGHSAAG